MKTIAQQLNIKEFPFTIEDKNGKVIYLEHSDGYWAKSEFNPNVNLIYYEDSSGLWIKREYDSFGGIIYHESSNGLIVDNRPNPCSDKVVEIDGIKYKLTAV
jgi:hypothetical protein